MIQGVIEQLSADFRENFTLKANQDTHPDGKWTRAYVDVSFEPNDVNNLYTALSSAHFSNPEMLLQLQQMYADIQQKIENDGIDPVQATLVRLAVDGLWLAEMFGLAPPEVDIRQQVIAAMQSIIQEAT